MAGGDPAVPAEGATNPVQSLDGSGPFVSSSSSLSFSQSKWWPHALHFDPEEKCESRSKQCLTVRGVLKVGTVLLVPWVTC